MRNHFDAIVIGAGPAGSTAAILLARAGWRVALIEKQRFPRRKVCGECISASNLLLLEALGIGKAFFDMAGPPLRQVAIMAGEDTIRADLPPFKDGAYPWGVALGREHLDALLLAQASRDNVQVFQPWVVRRIEGAPGNFECHIHEMQGEQQHLLSAAVLVDAHGAWEPLQVSRQQKSLRPSVSDLFAFKANFKHSRLEPGLLPVLAFPGGYGGMVLGDHGLTTLAFCIRRDTLASSKEKFARQKAALAAASHVLYHCKEAGNLLAGAEQRGAWLGTGPIHPGIRITRQENHAFLIGNAAGEAHPIIGEGITMAIQSAWLLAHTIAGYRSDIKDVLVQKRLQQVYAQAWLQHFEGRIRLSALFAHVAMRPALSAGLLPLLKRYPQALQHFARWSGKVRPAPIEQLSAPALLNINNLHL